MSRRKKDSSRLMYHAPRLHRPHTPHYNVSSMKCLEEKRNLRDSCTILPVSNLRTHHAFLSSSTPPIHPITTPPLVNDTLHKPLKSLKAPVHPHNLKPRPPQHTPPRSLTPLPGPEQRHLRNVDACVVAFCPCRRYYGAIGFARGACAIRPTSSLVEHPRNGPGSR